MSAELLFSICNNGVLPAWLLLAVAPGWSWTQRIVHAIWIPAALGLVYLWGFIVNPGTPEGGSFSTLQGVMILFTSPLVALVGCPSPDDEPGGERPPASSGVDQGASQPPSSRAADRPESQPPLVPDPVPPSRAPGSSSSRSS